MDKQKQIRKLYNSCYKDYDKHMNKTNHYKTQKNILKLLLDQIKEPILDLVCGTGFLLHLLSKKYSEVYGNDFSSKMVEVTLKKYNLPVTNDNAETLRLYNKKFRTIISCNLFFYLQNRNKAIRRWKELLEKEGKIIFIEEYPFIKPNSEEMDKHTEKLMNLVDPLSPNEIQKIMVKNGFLLIKKVETKIDGKHKLYGLAFSLE